MDGVARGWAVKWMRPNLPDVQSYVEYGRGISPRIWNMRFYRDLEINIIGSTMKAIGGCVVGHQEPR
jgi:hypothetical protein